MKFKHSLAALLTSSLLCCAMAPAQAAPVCVALTGKVSLINDDYGIVGNSVKLGDIVTGTYSYESTTPDTNSYPGVGDYVHQSGPYGMSLNVNGMVFRTDPTNVNFLIEIVDNHLGAPWDAMVMYSYNNLFPLGSNTNTMLWWQLDDPSGSVYSNTDLPTTAPNLAAFESSFGLNIQNDDFLNNFLIRAQVSATGPCEVTPAKKVTICHMPRTHQRKTMEIAKSALPAHLAHGDTLGACPKK